MYSLHHFQFYLGFVYFESDWPATSGAPSPYAETGTVATTGRLHLPQQIYTKHHLQRYKHNGANLSLTLHWFSYHFYFFFENVLSNLEGPF